MLVLNLSLTFLLLSSTCLAQSVCNKGCDLAHVEEIKDLASVYRYINTNASNIWKHDSDSTMTEAKWIQNLNRYDHINHLTNAGDIIETVNCTLRNRSRYVDFTSAITESLPLVGMPKKRYGLIWSSNREISFSLGSLIYNIPGRDENANNPPSKTCSGLSHGIIVGVTVVVVVVVLLLVRCIYNGVYRNKNAEISSVLIQNAQVQLTPTQGISVDKSMKFSYQELSKATHEFSLRNKIGQGGFGAVYYAQLRGENVAIKRMDMQASKEFLAELKVLTNVHHINLVRLIGYCVKRSLFLVYEYIENGNLSQHLHGSGRDPLPWSVRVQIALDSARALEYIHEYTVSIFIHCDIKSANILIDKNFHAKVADFGLTKLTGVGSTSRLGGTFGYMPPEYVQYGEVSPKVDVYAFGVVLYELISAKQAVIRANDSDDEPKGLVALFDEVVSQADPKDELVKMIDPRLGDNYPLDSVLKMAQLAKACTREDPRQRPSMRSVVGALMTLSSSTED